MATGRLQEASGTVTFDDERTDGSPTRTDTDMQPLPHDPSEDAPPGGAHPDVTHDLSMQVTGTLPGRTPLPTPPAPAAAGQGPDAAGAAQPAAGPDTLARRGPSRRGAILAGCAVVGSVLGVVAERLAFPATTPPESVAPAPTTSPTAVATQITSFDPSPGRSGFRTRDGGWRSETYASATFGNLKDGIGLLLDLGAARALRSVTVRTSTPTLTVELRAGDTAPTSSPKSLTLVGNPMNCTGTTALPATSGGSHRYWLVWVTSLGNDQGSFRAVIDSVTAQA